MVEFHRRHLLTGAASSALLTILPTDNRGHAQGWEAAALWVGEKLLEGAVAYVGGRLMGSALGEARITDVRSWIREAVAQLEAFVDAKLTQLVLDQMAADIDGIQNNLSEYASLRPSKRKENRFLIEAADIKTAAIIPLALKHEQALQIVLASLAFRFFSITALYELDRDRGHIFSQKAFVDQALITATATQKKLSARLSPDYRIKIECGDDPGYWSGGALDEGGREVLPPYSYCNVTLDGRGVGDQLTGENKDIALQEAQAFVTSRLRPAVDEQSKIFQQNSLTGFSLVMDCYNKMCARVGGSYTPPPDLGIQIPVAGETHAHQDRVLVGTGVVIVPN